MMPTVKVRPLVTRGSVPLAMTGSLRRLQQLAACCVQSWVLFASDEGGASDGCPSECNQHRTMTGSLRRLQELAACCAQNRLLSASDEGGASDGCPSECNEYRSLQPEDHRTLHDEIDSGGNPLGYDESDDLNAELAQALSDEQGEQHAEQADL
jgi:hypothetical protein